MSSEILINELKRSEQELKDIFNAAPVGLLLIRNRVMINVNDMFCKMLGYTKKEFIGNTTEMCYKDKAEYERVGKLLYEQIQTVGQARLEVKGRKKDGTIIDVLVTTANLKNSGMEDDIIFATIDITERNRIRESLMLTQTAIDKASDSIYWVRQDGSFGYVNEQACKELGYTIEELSKLTLQDIDPNFTALKQANLWDELKSKKKMLIETLHKSKSGILIPVEISLNYINFNNHEYSFAFVRNISKRKMANEALVIAHDKLRSEQQELHEKNVALKQVLNFMEKEKTDYKSEISLNIEQALIPFVKKLHKNDGKLSSKDIESLEDAIKTIVGHEIDDFNANYAKLTAREMDICELIKKGKSSQEIADSLNLSVQTIQKHRNSIRDKLQLKNKDINLPAYLRTK
ncbi:MAG: PAS domain S-box protein [bacterium]